MTAHILIVEDEPLLKKAYVEYLQLADDTFEIQSAETADTAINLFQQHKFDICILDWWLPNGGGEAILHAIAQNSNNCKIIIASGITSHIADTYLAHELVAGILPKPFPLTDLLAHIRNTLDGTMSLQG